MIDDGPGISEKDPSIWPNYEKNIVTNSSEKANERNESDRNDFIPLFGKVDKYFFDIQKGVNEKKKQEILENLETKKENKYNSDSIEADEELSEISPFQNIGLIQLVTSGIIIFILLISINSLFDTTTLSTNHMVATILNNIISLIVLTIIGGTIISIIINIQGFLTQ